MFLWGAALIVALPFLVAVYRKLESLALLLAEVSVQPAKAGHARDLLDGVGADSDRRDVRRVSAGGGAVGRDSPAIRSDGGRAAMRGAAADGAVALVRENPRDAADLAARDLRRYAAGGTARSSLTLLQDVA